MSEANACVGSGGANPASTGVNQPSIQALSNPISSSSNPNISQSPHSNTKSVMRSSLITTKNFAKSGASPGNTASVQVRHLSSSKIAKSSFSTSTSPGAKMINLQNPVVVSTGQSISGPSSSSSENVVTNIGSIGGNLISSSTTASNPISQTSVPHQTSIGTLVGGAVPSAMGNTAIKGFKTVVGSHALPAGKVDSNTRYILNSSKPPMTVNIAPAGGAVGNKVRFAPLMNLTTTGSLTVTDTQPQPQQHKVILQPTNQNPPAPGTVVVSSTKMQPTTAAPSPTAGTCPIRVSYPRRFAPQQPTSLPQAQGAAARIFQACVTTGAGSLPNIAPRMILASSSGENVQQTSGSALTVSQQDLQRLQQSGAIAPVVNSSLPSSGSSRKRPEPSLGHSRIITLHQTAPQVVIQPGLVRPEAANSPMRKRARKQQLQTVATPVTTPMTVEEEEEQKRNSLFLAASGPPAEVPTTPAPANRYRANSAQSSSSSSGRSTPRLVTSHHRKRPSPAKPSRKAVLHTARRARVNKPAPDSTSDTESDVEATVASNVCISGLLGNDDFHSPPTVTSSVRLGTSPLPHEPPKRSQAAAQPTNLRKRIFSQSSIRPPATPRPPPATTVSMKQAARRLSCERESSVLEEEALLDEDLEVDPIEEEVEAAEDEDVWCVSEEMVESVSCDDRYLPQMDVVQQQLPTDLSAVGANVAVSSTIVTEVSEAEIETVSGVSDAGTLIIGHRRMRIAQNYHCHWKPRSGHFQSYQDVRERKNDKKNAMTNLVVSMAEKKKLASMHWEVLCLLANFAHMKSTEQEKLERLENIAGNLRESKNTPEALKELVKGNLQRCRMMIEAITNQSVMLEKFVVEQSKDLTSFLAPVEMYCASNSSSPSNSNAAYRHHSRQRHSGVGGGNSSRTGSGAHRNLS